MQMTALGEGWVRQVLPLRPCSAHKGTFGTLAVLAGCARYRGAAALAAEAALRTGAGIVQVAGIERVCAAVAARLPACTLLPLPEDKAGGINAAVAPMLLTQRQTALLAGCGMGNTPATAALVQALLEGIDCPLLLDADALNALAGYLEAGEDTGPARRLQAALVARQAPTVLTPHLAEAARLAGQGVEQAAADPAALARSLAEGWGCTIVLKSHVTYIATMGQPTLLLDEGGNPGLAKGGSGDVLAGIIGALLAQGMAPHAAAGAGVWLHAAAGRAAVRALGPTATTPMDLPDRLSEVFMTLGR